MMLDDEQRGLMTYNVVRKLISSSLSVWQGIIEAWCTLRELNIDYLQTRNDKVQGYLLK